MTKIDEKNQNIENYDKSAVFHSKKFDEIGARVDDINKSFSYINKINPKVIEIGCGNGRDAKEIIKRTNDYLGIDLSKGMLEQAKMNVPEAKFLLADLENYEFSPGVDIVFAFASLLHSDKESIEKIVKSIYDSMNNSGVFFISLKYGDYHKETLDREGFGPRTYYFYNPNEIKNISPSGFNMVYQDIQDFRDQKWFSVILQKMAGL
ncbi:MAG: class I SAM-dependent methyltransferase [Candidatus Shapirobacteria bacterium]|nr:class I SAM-dependent methyltransferase [Candidatus Shapirobacteria bacterium]